MFFSLSSTALIPIFAVFLHNFISQKIRLISQYAKCEAIHELCLLLDNYKQAYPCRYHLLFFFFFKKQSLLKAYWKAFIKGVFKIISNIRDYFKNSWRLITVNYFWKNLNLIYLRGFKIHVCLCLIYAFVWKPCSQRLKPINFMS